MSRKSRKPAKSLAGQSCVRCGRGKFRLVQVDHVEELDTGDKILVPGLWVERCDTCLETVYPCHSVRFIEGIVAEKTGRLSPGILRHMRLSLGVGSQDEMSHLLGLGCKVWHKWESGKQYPSLSMNNYIRILWEVPGAFNHLKIMRRIANNERNK